jgi:hypothetical protein
LAGTMAMRDPTEQEWPWMFICICIICLQYLYIYIFIYLNKIISDKDELFVSCFDFKPCLNDSPDWGNNMTNLRWVEPTNQFI